MNQAILSVRVDANDKKSFESFCNDTGMNVSTAINMFIKTVLREKRLPFEIRLESFDEEIERKLLEAEKEMEKNGKVYTSEEVIESMNNIINNV